MLRILDVLFEIQFAHRLFQQFDQVVFQLVANLVYPAIVVIQRFAVDIRRVGNIFYGNLVKVLFGQQLDKSVAYGALCFRYSPIVSFQSAVHEVAPLLPSLCFHSIPFDRECQPLALFVAACCLFSLQRQILFGKVFTARNVANHAHRRQDRPLPKEGKRSFENGYHVEQ